MACPNCGHGGPHDGGSFESWCNEPNCNCAMPESPALIHDIYRAMRAEGWLAPETVEEVLAEEASDRE